jgi:urease subunit gamma/beta
VRLTPSEQDRLLLFTAAQLARTRRARGLLLNVPEATALIADSVAEAARDGARLLQAADIGRSVLSPTEVLPDVVHIVTEVKVEAVFNDGTRLVVVRDPFRLNESLPLTSTQDPIENDENATNNESTIAPGGIRVAHFTDVRYESTPQELVELLVTNQSLVPISITSHFHFFEVNARLDFDRAASYGMHLAIPAGSAQRFEPSQSTYVRLVPIGGNRIAIGFAGLVDGPLDAPNAKVNALIRATEQGYLGAKPLGPSATVTKNEGSE